MTDALEREPRATCLACFRPVALCYCDHLVPVANRTEIVIVQHAHERFHPFGTARMVARCLARARIAVDYDRSLRDGRRPLDLPENAALLFPGSGARNLADLPVDEHPAALVVLDGTWSQARALYRDLPALQRLPRLSFAAGRPSRYRIRRQPRAECLSTIEATVRALAYLEPGTTGLDAMLGAFEDMVDLQIAALARRARRPRSPRRRRPRGPGLPHWLADRSQSIVAIYGESAFVGATADALSGRALRGHPRTLIQWSAKRLSTGECFSRLIRPEALPLERRLAPTGLTARDLRKGVSLPSARSAWRAWLRPGDRLVSWNRSTLADLSALDARARGDVLKGIYKNHVRRRDPRAPVGGPIADVVTREGLAVAPLDVPGRAAQRLAQLEVLTHLLQTAAGGSSRPPRYL